jgi:hypothetical protein
MEETRSILGHMSRTETNPREEQDMTLLALERQFHAIAAELRAVRGDVSSGGSGIDLVEHPLSPTPQCLVRIEKRVDGPNSDAATVETSEAILARLEPIERAIMLTPATTVVGLGVKARHVAYVVAEYWNHSPEELDWHARAIRLLIEAVCEQAAIPGARLQG